MRGDRARQASAPFWANVWAPSIFVYALVPAILAIILYLVPFPDPAKISLFALLVLGWSLGFPALKGRFATPRGAVGLEAGKVDFWYYSLAIIGVLLFFFSGQLERERVQLRQNFDQLNINHQAALLNHDLLHNTANLRDRILPQLQALARRRAESLDEALRECAANINEELFRRPLTVLEIDPRRLDWDIPLQLADPQVVCYAYATGAPPEAWKEVEAAHTLDVAIAAIRRHDLGDHIPLLLGDRFTTASAVIEYASLDPGSSAWADKEGDLREQILELSSEIVSIAQHYASLGTDIGRQSTPLWLDRFARFSWPYIFIIALGMKIARKPYLHKPVT